MRAFSIFNLHCGRTCLEMPGILSTAKHPQWIVMLSKLLRGCSIIQNLPICPSAQLDTWTLSCVTPGEFGCVAVGVKREDLHEIGMLKLPQIFMDWIIHQGVIHYLLYFDRWLTETRIFKNIAHRTAQFLTGCLTKMPFLIRTKYVQTSFFLIDQIFQC